MLIMRHVSASSVHEIEEETFGRPFRRGRETRAEQEDFRRVDAYHATRVGVERS